MQSWKILLFAVLALFLLFKLVPSKSAAGPLRGGGGGSTTTPFPMSNSEYTTLGVYGNGEISELATPLPEQSMTLVPTELVGADKAPFVLAANEITGMSAWMSNNLQGSSPLGPQPTVLDQHL